MADTSGIINAARATVQDPNLLTPAAAAPAAMTAAPATTNTPATPAVTTPPPVTQSVTTPPAAPTTPHFGGVNQSYNTTHYNGQDVLVGSDVNQRMADSAAQYNQAEGKNLTAQQYDQMINPTTYGARWGVPESQMTAAPGGAAPAPNGAAQYSSTQLGDPTKWSVTPNQTVAGQLTGIMDPNSPIIQQARAQGLQLANERGLLNSSIGEGAAMNAAYNVAVPIANADAATYGKAAGYNADQSNQFATKNADFANTQSQFNASQQNQLTAQQLASKTQLETAHLSADTQTKISQLQSQTQTNLAYLDNATKTNLANLDAGTRTNLATIEANYHQLMQSNQSASDLFRQVTQNITTISMSKDMDGQAKQSAVDNQLQMLKNGMQINGAVSNLNLGDLLDFSKITQPTIPAVDLSQQVNG